MSTTTDIRDDQLRHQAVERLKKRSEFWSHLAVYLFVNALIVTVWFLAVDGGFFWPLFPLFGWGIGVFFHALDVFRRPYSEERIRREMDRLT
jgi:predicted membrane channel-forming protein YqfA (hemolysin III family)